MQQAFSGKQLCHNCLAAGTPFRSAPHSGSSRRRERLGFRILAAEQEAKTVERSGGPEERLTEEEASEVESGSGSKVLKRDDEGKIYIGFDKNDPEPRTGRKGRMIDDDEERYPSRSEMAGGWAGGEKGLRAFIEEAEKTGAASEETFGGKQVAGKSAKGKQSQTAKELDPGAYPGKESVGFFPGITGGFAGGERGVQQFVEKGELELVKPGKEKKGYSIVPGTAAVAAAMGGLLLHDSEDATELAFQTGNIPGTISLASAEKKEFSILLIAGVAAVAAALGGLLLDDSEEAVEKAVQTGNIPGLNLSAAPVDESTKLALKVAVALLGVVGISVGVRAVVKSVKEGTGRLAQQVLDIGKIGAFWIGVFVAVKFVLESSN